MDWRSRLALAASILVAVTCTSAPAVGDWLYFKDGTTLETAGPWEVRGRMLRFKTRSGVLQMVAAEEIDLRTSANLSKWARPDEGLNELRSAADVRQPGYVTTEWFGSIQLDAHWDLVYYAWSSRFSPGGLSDRPKCVPAAGLAVTDNGTLVLQIGTTIENVALCGIGAFALPAMRERVEGRALCFVERDSRGPRYRDGRHVGYLITREGHDLGLQMIQAGNARPSDEAHHLADEYLAAQRRAGRPGQTSEAGESAAAATTAAPVPGASADAVAAPPR